MEYLLWETGYSTMWGRLLFSIPFLFGGLVGALVVARGKQRRSFFILRALFCIAVCCAVAYFLWPWASQLQNIPILIAVYFAQFIMIVASVLFCVRCSLKGAVFYGENGLMAFSMVKLIFDSIGAITIYYGVDIEPYGAVYSILYFGIGIVVYTGLYFLLRYKRYGETEVRVGLTKLLFPTTAILLVSIYFNIQLTVFLIAYSLEADIIVMVKGLLILCCLLVLLINFDVFTFNHQQQEMETISQLNKKQQEQFAFSKANVEALNMKYHDLKGMIGSLRKVADNNVAASLREAEAQIEAYDKTAKTGNSYLDVLLTERSIYCERNGIQFTYSVEGEALSFMQPMDIISFFNNCTGNAIEAVSALPQEKRIITLSCSRRQGMLSVRCDNYFTGALNISGGLPSTSKKDASEHGFGLKSMQLIAKKYGGKLSFSAEGEIFSLTAIFPLA